MSLPQTLQGLLALCCALQFFGPLDGVKAQQDPKPETLTVTTPTWPNTTCPIMGKPISMRLFVDTELGRFYVCCRPCNRKILRDTETAYMTAYPVNKEVLNKVCPVSGKPIPEKPTTIRLQGHEIALCSEECIPAARKHHQITLLKATDPKVIDIANKACPINGEEVDDNAFVLIGNNLVMLSSQAAAREVSKNPAKALATAKDKTRKAKPSTRKPAPPDESEDDEKEKR